ncbi:glycosyltransferase [Methylobacterium symbioticum]|uniref:Phosphatidyl-myo-inositol mannosyltransferase n=2 Tax=Methylobacterium symbioticum TaxID=2584084 RepID=A0A509EHF7_9HYPH|nr:Phosphatidyl-myo-inositol mannosyltransferase [Methylobacterium symbioticum]
MDKPLKILALSFFPSFQPSSSGGELGLYGLLNALSRDHSVLLLSSADVAEAADAAPVTHYHNQRFQEIRIPKETRFHAIWSRYGDAASHADISNVCVAKLGETATRFHEIFLEHYDWADVIMHDSPYALTYDLFLGMDNKVRFYNSQNVEKYFVRTQYPAEVEGGLYDYVDGLERRLLQQADVVGACSIEDMEAFAADLGPSAERCIVYRAIDQERVEREPHSGGPLRVVFGGSKHPPNTEAARFIVEALAPRFPEVQFDIFGSCLAAGSYGTNLTAHGFVSDEKRHDLLVRAHVALNPIRSGSGVNLKVLESAAYGLAIISTEFGLRGTALKAGADCLAGDYDQFADLLTRLMHAPDLCQTLGAAARQVVEDNHRWTRTADSVAAALRRAKAAADQRPVREMILAVNDYDVARSVGGGASRIQQIYSRLAADYRTVVLAFSNDDTLTSEWRDEVFYCRVPKTEAHIAEEHRINAMFHISANDTTASQFVAENRMMVALFRYLSGIAARVVFEHPYMSPLAEVVETKFVYSAHNWEFSLKEKLLQHHPERIDILSVAARVEDFCAEHAELIIAVAEGDLAGIVRSSIARGALAGPGSIVIRSGGEDPVPRERFGTIAVPRPYIVFLGSAHPPNIDAARFVVDRLAPALPAVDFRFVGSVCDCLSAATPNVILHGVVDREEKSRLLYGARIALNPMMEGSGSNVKMTEYLGHGIPIVSTPFGARGFDARMRDFVTVAPLEEFAACCRDLLDQPSDAAKREAAIAYFHGALSLTYLAGQFGESLRDLGRPKKRILAVLTRYNDPPLGGAEVHMLEFVTALSRDGRYHVDVVTPDISRITDQSRFLSTFGEGATTSVPTGLERVHWARFPLDTRSKADEDRAYRMAAHNWDAQMLLDEARIRHLSRDATEIGLGWGWHDPESWSGRPVRWAGYQTMLMTRGAGSVVLKGTAPRRTHLRFLNADDDLIMQMTVSGSFTVELDARRSAAVTIVASTERDLADRDPRPRAFAAEFVQIGDQVIDLARNPWTFDNPTDAIAFYYDNQNIRADFGANLGASRGPFCESLKRAVEAVIGDYDLVITHNPVLKHVSDTVAAAAAAGVPSVLVPHLHLDDDYYHFPDILDATRNATLSLLSPSSLCRLFNAHGVDNVRHLPAGAEFTEPTAEDRIEFERLYDSEVPFFLVLGRKNATKNYISVINAVETLNARHRVNVVMIGADEDGIPVQHSWVRYLGWKSTGVAAAALKSCLGLVTMSRSESFGIIVAEAWLAGAPVVANRNCAAFCDLIADEGNGLLADDAGLARTLERLIDDTDLRERLVANGRREAERYRWDAVGAEFVAICDAIIAKRAAQPLDA